MYITLIYIYICHSENKWHIALFNLKCYIFRYLAVSGRSYGAPISGHIEVVGDYSVNAHTQWMAMEGLFIHPNDFSAQHHRYDRLHEEL